MNDIAVHPRRPELVATASKDQTLRLWNLVNGRPILLCQGDGGHSNEVLTLDWKMVGSEYSLVSAGMDSYIKIWYVCKYTDVCTSFCMSHLMSRRPCKCTGSSASMQRKWMSALLGQILTMNSPPCTSTILFSQPR